ncbi:MAG: hypothetical protein ABI656_04950 [bacterium]
MPLPLLPNIVETLTVTGNASPTNHALSSLMAQVLGWSMPGTGYR